MTSSHLSINHEAHVVTMVCTFILLVKFTVTILIQLSLAKLYKAKQTYGMGQPNPKHAEADIRWQRIVLNDLENIPLGLIVAWASLLSTFSAQVHIIGVCIFTVSRIFHTVSYAYKLQPHRGIAWMVAVCSVLVLAANGTAGVLM